MKEAYHKATNPEVKKKEEKEETTTKTGTTSTKTGTSSSNSSDSPPPIKEEDSPSFDPQPLLELAYKRKGLIVGVALPMFVIFRHPGIVMAAVRIGASIAAFAFHIIARNPHLRSVVGAYLWKVYA